MEDRDLTDHFERMLQQTCALEQVRAVESGESADAMWRAIVESGFLDALVSEQQGGAGLSLASVEPLFELLGAHVTPLPVAETMVARAILASHQLEYPQGPIALVTSPIGGGLVPASQHAEYFLVDTLSKLVLIPAAVFIERPRSERASIDPDDWGTAAAEYPSLSRSQYRLRPIAAVILAAFIAGAVTRLLDLTVKYANEREQFGKPIGRQQALQQSIAIMAEDVVAARLAAQIGCSAGLAVPSTVAAVAKSVTSDAASQVAATAHAVHGAVGISEEYGLHLWVRRLHHWRLAEGSSNYWNKLLGSQRFASSDDSVTWIRTSVFG